MSIQVSDNFKYLGKKPIDDRMLYSTLSEMVSIPETSLYEGCKAYVIATGKEYQYKSGNTVDANTGKWRSTEVDLSGYQKIFQYSTLPAEPTTVPNSGNPYGDMLVQYMGETNANFTKGHFYECVFKNTYTSYCWYTDIYVAGPYYTKTNPPEPADYTEVYTDKYCNNRDSYWRWQYSSGFGGRLVKYNSTYYASRYPSGDFIFDVYEWVDITDSIIPTDISDLTDSTGVIPTDISDLTDSTGVIPSEVKDLSDVRVGSSITDDDVLAWDSEEEKFVNKPQSGGGSGGHTIQDSTGTDMTARDNLQFGEGFDVTDDSTNDATIIEPYELTNADIEEILSELPSPLSGSNKGCIPCGKVEAFYRETAPDGYLVCDGTEYAKADYPKLASILLGLTEHTQYEGSDSDHFKVPDLRGEYLRGSGTNSHTNQGSGAAVGVHQDATEIPNTWLWGNQWFGIGASGNSAGSYNGAKIENADYLSNGGYKAEISLSDKGTASNVGRYTSRPTSTSVLFCIAYKDIFLTTELPVLFDERSTEQPIGKYVRSDGKWKPVYRKEKTGTTTGADNSSLNLSISNIETITNFNAYIQSKNNNNWYPNNYNYSDYKFFCNVGQDGVVYYYKYGTSSGYFDNANLKFIAEYTKTTDEWR